MENVAYLVIMNSLEQKSLSQHSEQDRESPEDCKHRQTAQRGQKVQDNYPPAPGHVTLPASCTEEVLYLLEPFGTKEPSDLISHIQER